MRLNRKRQTVGYCHFVHSHLTRFSTMPQLLSSISLYLSVCLSLFLSFLFPPPSFSKLISPTSSQPTPGASEKPWKWGGFSVFLYLPYINRVSRVRLKLKLDSRCVAKETVRRLGKFEAIESMQRLAHLL